MSLQIWIWAHLHIRYMHLGGQMPMVWSLRWLSWQFEMNGLPTVPNFNGTPVFGILAGDPRERKLQQVKYSHRLANIFVTVCERNPCFESSQDLCPAVHTNVSRSLYPSSKCIASWGTFRPGMRSTKTCQFLVPKTIVHGLWPTFSGIKLWAYCNINTPKTPNRSTFHDFIKLQILGETDRAKLPL